LLAPEDKTGELAQVLVEFAEDVHNNIGIWRSLEQYNLEFFGTPLPLTLPPGEKADSSPMNRYRIQHLLWTRYHLSSPHIILPPNHQGLIFLADIISNFLEKRFEKIPRSSGIKVFFDHPNDYGKDVKGKLLWLGMHSYLFRICFHNYVKENGGKAEIGIIDDFVCQNATCWSGLGVIDILASMLDITEQQRNELRSWYERHLAIYRILEIKEPYLEALNVINEKQYKIWAGELSTYFDKRNLYYGSLVPWDGEWCWSGEQRSVENMSDPAAFDIVKKNFIESMQKVAFRYCEDLLDKGKKLIKEHFRYFREYYGDELAIFPDGYSMAEGLNEHHRIYHESKVRDGSTKLPENRKYEPPDFKKAFPPEILKCNNGMGVYFNPVEGYEVIREFNDVVNGFKRKGVRMRKDEVYAVRGLICSQAICPGLVKKLVQEYGHESVSFAFLIPADAGAYYLDYLLRRHKGDYYRNRYPNVTLTEID